MTKLLSSANATLQRGSLGLVIIGTIAVGLLLGFALFDQERLYRYMLFAFFGAVLTWRHFLVWRRRRDQGGVELLGTEQELESLYRKPRRGTWGPRQR